MTTDFILALILIAMVAICWLLHKISVNLKLTASILHSNLQKLNSSEFLKSSLKPAAPEPVGDAFVESYDDATRALIQEMRELATARAAAGERRQPMAGFAGLDEA
ncbi:MAG: hypothetical protein ABIG63_11260 [Chloroflexota bacterium]